MTTTQRVGGTALTIPTNHKALDDLIRSIAGWLCDLVRTREKEMQIANTADERWRKL